MFYIILIKNLIWKQSVFATVTELEHTVPGIFIVQFIGDDLEVGR